MNCALRGNANLQVQLGVRRCIRRPVTWSMLRDAADIVQSWGPGGRVMWMCSMSLSCFLIARADEMFAACSGTVHPAHCLTRPNVALFRGDNRLEYLTGDEQIG